MTDECASGRPSLRAAIATGLSARNLLAARDAIAAFAPHGFNADASRMHEPATGPKPVSLNQQPGPSYMAFDKTFQPRPQSAWMQEAEAEFQAAWRPSGTSTDWARGSASAARSYLRVLSLTAGGSAAGEPHCRPQPPHALTTSGGAGHMQPGVG